MIDVNTGSFTGKGKSARLEDTITKTNLEAAEEVVRQLRLRDIGGIIVIDFIDMARSRNREAVLKVLRKALDEDRTKTFVVEISPLGLVEMTRQNVTDGVREIMTKPCPVCSRRGRREVRGDDRDRVRPPPAPHGRARPATDGPEAYLLRINPKVTAWFIADGARELHALEAETGRYFHFEGSDGLPLDHFAVTMEGTRAEIEEHAVPFRAGEEVHVDLVEPHMYNDDDAVAKVDGYLIDVVNGVAFVGEKKLVRIEEAGRTIARAVLVGADAEAAEEAAARARRGAREGAWRPRGARPRPRRARRSGRERDEAAATLADETPPRPGPRPARGRRGRPPRPRRRRARAGAAPRTAAAAADAEPPAPARRGRRRRRRGEPAEAADGRRSRRRKRARAQAPPSRPRRGRRRGARRRRRGAPEAPAPSAASGRARKRPAAAEEAVEARAEEAEEDDARAASAARGGRRPAAEEPEAGRAEEPRGRPTTRRDDDDALSSRPRRRGRRGGRRRSRAKAQADAEVSD